MTLTFPRWIPSAALKCAVPLFWCWNVVFICCTLPLLPEVAGLLRAWWQADVPGDYLALLLAWLVVPWLCVAVAWKRLRGRPQALALFFFAAEGPFFSLCLYRLIAMREVTPAVGQWLAMMVFGWCVVGAAALWRSFPRTGPWHALRLAGATCLVLVAAYAGALSLLAWLPLALRGAWEVFDASNWGHVLAAMRHGPTMVFFILVAALLVLLTAASLLLMPPCMALAGWRAGARAWEGGPLGQGRRAAVVVAVLALQAGAYAVVNHQPQQAVFARLDPTGGPAAMAPDVFETAQESLRAGLLNAYLAPYRYASSEGESRGIAKLYEGMLGLPPRLAELPQAAFNALAKPMLYDGADMATDAQRAAMLYERYFDTPIQKGERAAIARALSATHDSDARESGLVNIDQRKVWVAEQRVKVEPQGAGDLARITLDETYVNLTAEQQEIFYLFSLPESAAITGLWLGDSPSAMLPHTLSPRGAAQRVYKAEVNRRVDPALLEQVGPRQYRLRAFPVPPRPRPDPRGGVADVPPGGGQKLYLRLQYTAFADGRGAWPLPSLAEKRNVAFDKHTRRICDGGACPSDGVNWWPAELPGARPAPPVGHAFRLQPQGSLVVARPAPDAGDTAAAPRGKNVLLVVDRSRSMAAHRRALLEALGEARRRMAGNTVSVLLTTTGAMGPHAPVLVPLERLADEQAAVFMGGGKVDDLLRQAAGHGPAAAPDLTLVLTDSGAFDLDAGKAAGQRPAGGMLSFVHLGGALSPVYDDATLQAVQSSGGSAFGSVGEAWRHFADVQRAGPGFLMRRDAQAFFTAPEDGAAPQAADDPAFAPIAARLFIADAARRGKAGAPVQLDALHALAGRHDVVTPYSSMIVLVNDEQRQALARAQAEQNRFDRDHETGIETLPKPNNPLSASATPEPEEWLMLLVSAGAAAWMWKTRRRRLPAGGAAAAY